MLIEAPGGELRCILQAEAEHFPPALGVAVARAIEAGLAELSDAGRARVARLQAAGHGLGLVFERDSGYND